MRESFPGVLDNAQSDQIHELTKSYMELLETGEINDLFVGEYLAGQIATGEITEDVAEAVIENLGIDQVIDD